MREGIVREDEDGMAAVRKLEVVWIEHQILDVDGKRLIRPDMARDS